MNDFSASRMKEVTTKEIDRRIRRHLVDALGTSDPRLLSFEQAGQKAVFNEDHFCIL